jgi:hypothetical protein
MERFMKANGLMTKGQEKELFSFEMVQLTRALYSMENLTEMEFSQPNLRNTLDSGKMDLEKELECLTF